MGSNARMVLLAASLAWAPACGARTGLGTGLASDAGEPDAPAGSDAAGDASAPPKAPRLALGVSHTCAVMLDATVRCWGWNQHGELGDGTTVSRSKPAPVPGLANVRGAAGGYFHTCAALLDGTVQCWGNDGSGQSHLVPTLVPVLKDVQEVTAATSSRARGSRTARSAAGA